MSEMITVHRIGAEPVELPRSQVHLTERTRWLSGLACQQKRFYGYHWGGIGISSARPSEDLLLGRAVHKGLEEMLRDVAILDQPEYGGGFKDYVEACAQSARQEMIDAAAEGIAIQDSESYGEESPELAQLLVEEQANLAYALVWAFGRKRLAGLLERYEVVAVEPEINWLVGTVPANTWDSRITNAGRLHATHIVMMSRPDAVLRSRKDGKLRTVSWKTSKRFDQEYVEKLECDVQGITEGLAVQALYGEEVAGAFYTYFIKGDKKWSADIGMKRYESYLIRPYSQWTGIGEPQYKTVYQWHDEVGQLKRLGRGWDRVDIWNSLSMPEWLELLDSGTVQPEAKRNWLEDVVAEPLEQLFNVELAKSTVQEIVRTEQWWMETVSGGLVTPKNSGSCFTWGKKCQYFSCCYRGDSVERNLASGRFQMRTPNHPGEITGDSNEIRKDIGEVP